MEREFCTICPDEVTNEIVIEKSRFIATAKRVDTVEQALEFVKRLKKQYYDATHNCYAYIVDANAKFSDDGEPQGTAGLPMYECLKRLAVDHVCVVVTRYFGGVKLGAGGLVRAYSGSVADLLNGCKRLSFVNCFKANVTVEYTLYDFVRRALRIECLIQNVDFADKVTLSVLAPVELSTTLSDIVTQTTNGKGIFTITEQLLFPYEWKEGKY